MKIVEKRSVKLYLSVQSWNITGKSMKQMLHIRGREIVFFALTPEVHVS
jgi:hypothetical protein